MIQIREYNAKEFYCAEMCAQQYYAGQVTAREQNGCEELLHL